mmetsp:Transcript_10840/g.33247  ORF Transcript_10840/g.33247 Transcript_10840/m.33247 type:complete len:178 (+) Transcript_10840:138-671(+)
MARLYLRTKTLEDLAQHRLILSIRRGKLASYVCEKVRTPLRDRVSYANWFAPEKRNCLPTPQIARIEGKKLGHLTAKRRVRSVSFHHDVRNLYEMELGEYNELLVSFIGGFSTSNIKVQIMLTSHLADFEARQKGAVISGFVRPLLPFDNVEIHAVRSEFQQMLQIFPHLDSSAKQL